MPPHLTAMVWGQLLCENWIDHPVYKEVPDWSINKGGEAQNQDQKYLRGKEQEINKQSLAIVPPAYQTVIEELLKEDYYSSWFETVCGYQQKIKFIDVWNGSDDLKWHWDGVEDHDMGFLIYFTEQHQWN